MSAAWKDEPQYIELKKGFELSLQERKLAVEQVLVDLEKGANLEELAQRFHFLVHKLAGVARSFDYVKLADLSESEDECWDQILSSKQAFQKNTLVDSIKKLLSELNSYSCKI